MFDGYINVRLCQNITQSYNETHINLEQIVIKKIKYDTVGNKIQYKMFTFFFILPLIISILILVHTI